MALCVRSGHYEGPPDSTSGLPFGLVKSLVDLTDGRLQVHWASGLFGAWAALMVSKSLKVPKL